MEPIPLSAGQLLCVRVTVPPTLPGGPPEVTVTWSNAGMHLSGRTVAYVAQVTGRRVDP